VSVGRAGLLAVDVMHVFRLCHDLLRCETMHLFFVELVVQCRPASRPGSCLD
jgi:hypothetical protein